MANIEASVFDKLFKLFDNVSKSLTKSFDALAKLGYEYQDANKDDDGNLIFKCKTSNNNLVKVKCVPVNERPGLYDVYIKGKIKNGKVTSVKCYKHVSESNFDKVIVEYVEKYMDESLEDSYEDKKNNDEIHDKDADFNDLEDGDENVAESRKINATFRRITASKSDSICLVAVKANYDPTLAMADITNLVNDDDFCNDIPCNVDYSVEIKSTPESLTVAPCDDCKVSTSDCIFDIISYILEMRDIMQCVHWNAKGDLMKALHSDVEGFYYSINYQLDFFAELQVELNGYMPSLASIRKYSEEIIDCSQGFSAQKGYEIMYNVINRYICLLKLYYCNFTSDVQSAIDDYIRQWSKDANYFIKQIRK